ncbi:N-acetylglucosamine-6-phosphate deacetylase [Methylacidiphilum infernorum V4]|uniref:N-acetylglucosamine-6-phosphate deacetylase n=1 Tax=Methylacidiphilum infernorum (isolate V4) TaxID=481448 RepID=B3E0M1_METI4|nr:N-acetylglucosamine-6-phosphate deacetylase [Methylacidiphilum infernorum V4]
MSSFYFFRFLEIFKGLIGAVQEKPSNNGHPCSSVIAARDYRTGMPLKISLAEGVYQKIEAQPKESAGSLPWIAPGLFDLQINGFGGIDLNGESLSQQQFEILCRKLLESGCSHFLATVITRPLDSYRHWIEKLEKLRQVVSLNCLGFHLEGPFLSGDPGCRGVHCPEWMTKPDVAWLEEIFLASAGSIKLITLAPEVDPEATANFIKKADSLGITVGLGHSKASWEVIQSSVLAGAKLWTHLGNALSHTIPKFDNLLLNVIASDLPYVSLIPDGKHIPPVAFRALITALGQKVVLVSDAMAGAAAPPGNYFLGHVEIEVDSQGKARDKKSGRLGGSTLRPFEGVFIAQRMTGISWRWWWDAYSIRPAAVLGIDHGLKEGNEASFCLFDLVPSPVLRALYLRGRKVYP